MIDAEPTTEIRVKVADCAVGRDEQTLITIGLGSCVAIILYDARARIGGLAHTLLPNESMARDRSNPAKFPASAVVVLRRYCCTALVAVVLHRYWRTASAAAALHRWPL